MASGETGTNHSSGEPRDWRKDLISQLRDRNRSQTNCFEDLISLHNRLFDRANTLRGENLQLSVANEKLKCEVTTGGSAVGGSGANAALEARLLAQAEELTTLHRRRGEHAQQIVDLNNKLQEMMKELQNKEVSLAESLDLNALLRSDLSRYVSKEQDLEAANQMLRDEHQALQLAFAALEEKLRRAQEENRGLVERLIKYKAKDADKMNEENDNFLKKRQAKVQKDLEDAARDTRTISPDRTSLKEGIVGLPTSVPANVSVKFNAHDGEVSAVKWSPVDRILATGGADRKIKLWDISKGAFESKGMLVGSNASVMSVDFDSTGTLILGASNDYASRVWSVSDLRLRHTLTGHCAKVMAAKFLGEPSKVVTGSHDRTLKIWDLRSRACIETKFAGSSCNDLVTSDGAGSTIISGHFDKRIRFWDTRAESSSNDIVLQGKVTSLDLSRGYDTDLRDINTLISIPYKQIFCPGVITPIQCNDIIYTKLEICDETASNVEQQNELHQTRDFIFSDANYLLSCVRDDTVKLLDLRMKQIVGSFSADGFKVGCDWARATFSPDGQYIAVGSVDGSVYIWNVTTNKIETVLKDHTSAVTAVAWHPHGTYLASVDRAKGATVWGDHV